MIPDQCREETLLLARETRHIGIFDEVARVQLELTVGYTKPGFVQISGPAQ